MKTYFAFIKYTQHFMMTLSVIILAVLPSALVFYPEFFTTSMMSNLYALVHLSLFFVMLVRPAADIFSSQKWIRPLVILRKGFGVFSASIAVSFILEKMIMDAGGYLASFVTLEYWSLANFALFAHMADVSAILLLVTSNNLSKRLLGKNWKRIQRLSYVYFYGSAAYVVFMLQDMTVLLYVFVVTLFTVMAFVKKRLPKEVAPAMPAPQASFTPTNSSINSNT